MWDNFWWPWGTKQSWEEFFLVGFGQWHYGIRRLAIMWFNKQLSTTDRELAMWDNFWWPWGTKQSWVEFFLAGSISSIVAFIMP
jgi:hypothetical protein